MWDGSVGLQMSRYMGMTTIRRLFGPLCLVIWFVLSAAGQTDQQRLSTTDALARTVQTSLCEVLRSPKEFNGKIVKIRARNSVN
jgi:hypothetical protein